MSGLKPEINAHDQQLGDINSTVTLVEFGDYQCPHCGRAYPLIKQLLRDLGDKLHFVFRNFPLSEIHPLALPAAIAAEAAGLQGKFWQMHNIIFENQTRLHDNIFVEFAKRIRIDSKRFLADTRGRAVSDKVESDFESGVRSGVNGTPSFFINKEKFDDYDGSYESIRNAIDRNL
jgi:protein-disulfide isomerase